MKRYPLKYKGETVAYIERHPFYQAFLDLKYGLFIYRYPLCCIFQYVIETLKCEPSSYKRNEEYGSYNHRQTPTYVPCNHCMKRIIREDM